MTTVPKQAVGEMVSVMLNMPEWVTLQVALAQPKLIDDSLLSAGRNPKRKKMKQVFQGFFFGMILIFFAVGLSTTIDVIFKRTPSVCKQEIKT